MQPDDWYALLEVQPGASAEELKRAYRDLTKVWHPDRFASDAALRRKAEEKLKAINEAYESILAARAEGWDSAMDSEPPAATRAEPSPHQKMVRNRTWALTCAAAAVFVLLRRPTPGGLIVALLLFCAAAAFTWRLRV